MLFPVILSVWKLTLGLYNITNSSLFRFFWSLSTYPTKQLQHCVGGGSTSRVLAITKVYRFSFCMWNSTWYPAVHQVTNNKQYVIRHSIWRRLVIDHWASFNTTSISIINIHMPKNCPHVRLYLLGKRITGFVIKHAKQIATISFIVLYPLTSQRFSFVATGNSISRFSRLDYCDLL